MAPVEAAMSTPALSRAYLLMVQSLIERCLLLNMSREECACTLQKQACVDAVITCTVWQELERENPDFFRSYTRLREDRLIRQAYMQRGAIATHACAQQLEHCQVLLRERQHSPQRCGSESKASDMGAGAVKERALSELSSSPAAAC
jgi:uncharacterized protein (TIGR01589 family)